MPSTQKRSIVRYERRDAEEDRAWTRLYRRAADPSVAAEVVRQLDLDAEAKRWHLGLYLRCRQTLRRRKERQARSQRIGRLVRAAFGALVLRPIAALRRLLEPRERFDDVAVIRPSEPAARAGRQLRPMLIEALSPTEAASTVSPPIEESTTAAAEKAA